MKHIMAQLIHNTCHRVAESSFLTELVTSILPFGFWEFIGLSNIGPVNSLAE